MARKARRPLPAEILNPPEVSEYNALAWKCFWDLRRGLDDCTPIRWTDTLLWAQAYGLSTAEMEGLQLSVVILDGVLIPFNTAKRKAADDKAAAIARGSK